GNIDEHPGDHRSAHDSSVRADGAIGSQDRSVHHAAAAEADGWPTVKHVVQHVLWFDVPARVHVAASTKLKFPGDIDDERHAGESPVIKHDDRSAAEVDVGDADDVLPVVGCGDRGAAAAGQAHRTQRLVAGRLAEIDRRILGVAYGAAQVRVG